jgi:hypothetical protein
MANLPNLYLWAWERPEDLRFLSDKKVGVAFLAKSLSLAQPLAATFRDSNVPPDSSFFNSIRVNDRPRLQPLHVTPGTPLMAVVRIESVRGAFPRDFSGKTAAIPILSAQDLSLFANVIASASQISGVTALQIDFDATTSEHTFYKELLIEVRKRIPAEMPLSITALASWCIGDRWLEQLPPGTIDEAVPMLFRMGMGSVEVSRYIGNGNGFTVSACATSLGVSTDEPLSWDVLNGKISVNRASSVLPRIYVFSPHAWDQAEAEDLLKKVANWHAN